MLKIKEDRMEELANFGFRKGPKYWNHETENAKVGRESRELGVTSREWAAFALRVPNVIAQLVRADMVEED